MHLNEAASTLTLRKPATAEPTVFVVDGNPGVRASIQRVLQASHIASESFASAPEFLKAYDPTRPGCLVVDFRMAGFGGHPFQQELLTRGIRIPRVVISGSSEVAEVVAAIRGGAVDFLEKPLQEEALLRSVRDALQQDHSRRQDETRLSSLTPRERQILELLVAGENYKEIAGRLQLSTKTVEGHRVNLLRKLGLATVIDLVKFILERQLS